MTILFRIFLFAVFCVCLWLVLTLGVQGIEAVMRDAGQ